MAAVTTTRRGPIIASNTNRIGIVTGDHATLTSSTGVTEVLKSNAGFLHNVAIQSVGTTWTIDLYDDTAAANNRVWSWVTADGKGPFALQIPLQAGLVLVTTGTAGAATIVWS